MADLAEKMEKRIHNLEEVISMLNNETKEGRSKAQRLELNDDEIWGHMSKMQKDVGDRLELRMTEVVQWLLME